MMSNALSSGQGAAHPLTSFSTQLDPVIDNAIIGRRIVGGVILITHRGQPVYRRAAGLADRKAGRPMTERTLFRLASVSKPIVTAAAMVLVARGKLVLDEDIGAWLPDFRPRLDDGSSAHITLRQLLSHTAGLGYRFFEADDRGPYALAGVSDGMDISGISLAENLRRLANVPLLYRPGTAWGYSLAIDVAGAVIEQVCGQPLDQAVRQLLTGPLGMEDTDFFARDNDRLAVAYVNDTPWPHRLRDGEVVPAFEGTLGVRFAPSRAGQRDAFPSGGAGMVGSADDVMRLLEMLRQGGAPLIPPRLVAEMGRDQTGGLSLPDAPGFGFGLGFSVLRDPAAAASPESVGTWRWGGAYGHAWFVDPARELSVVAMTNTLYEGMSGAFVAEVRDAVYAALAARARS